MTLYINIWINIWDHTVNINKRNKEKKAGGYCRDTSSLYPSTWAGAWLGSPEVEDELTAVGSGTRLQSLWCVLDSVSFILYSPTQYIYIGPTEYLPLSILNLFIERYIRYSNTHVTHSVSPSTLLKVIKWVQHCQCWQFGSKDAGSRSVFLLFDRPILLFLNPVLWFCCCSSRPCLCLLPWSLIGSSSCISISNKVPSVKVTASKNCS